MRYGDLLEAKATKTEINELLVEGDMAATTFCFSKNLKRSAVEVAQRKGMGFLTSVRMGSND